MDGPSSFASPRQTERPSVACGRGRRHLFGSGAHGLAECDGSSIFDVSRGRDRVFTPLSERRCRALCGRGSWPGCGTLDRSYLKFLHVRFAGSSNLKGIGRRSHSATCTVGVLLSAGHWPGSHVCAVWSVGTPLPPSCCSARSHQGPESRVADRAEPPAAGLGERNPCRLALQGVFDGPGRPARA